MSAMYRWRLTGVALSLLVSNFAFAAQAGDRLIMQGSTTFNTRLIVPYQGEIEALAKVNIDVIPTKSTYGLEALLDGRAALAMISGPLESELIALRTKRPAADLDRLKAYEIARTGVAFVTHPSNSVRKLTVEQIERILDGKISSWADLGGANLPIRPVFVRDGGVIVSVQTQLLAGRPVSAPHAVPVETPRNVLRVVVQEAGALGVAQSALARQMALQPVETDRSIDQVLNIVVLGAPTTQQMRLIEAMRVVANQNLK